MGEFTRVELAEHAGVPAEFVDRLVELGIVAGGDVESSFSKGDVRRARFAHGLERGGVPLDAVAVAVASGDLSFAFFDEPYWDRFAPSTATTFRELSTKRGSITDAAIGQGGDGVARPSPDDRVREDDLGPVALVKATLAAGVGAEALERQVRIWGESIRRIADADSTFYHSQFVVPLLASGLSQGEMLRAVAQAGAMLTPLLDKALISMYHAQSEHTWMANGVEAVEAALERLGLHRSAAHPPAMCFLDLAGYTRLTEERGDQRRRGRGRPARNARPTILESPRAADRSSGWAMASWCTSTSPPRPSSSRSRRWRGIPAADLPSGHVGIDAGPLIFQDGDYFGRTVNMAARIATRADAGQVLVSDSVRDGADDPGLAFIEVGFVELKGLSAPSAGARGAAIGLMYRACPVRARRARLAGEAWPTEGVRRDPDGPKACARRLRGRSIQPG